MITGTVKSKLLAVLQKLRGACGFERCMAALPVLYLLAFVVAPLFIVFKVSFSCSDFAVPPFTQIFSWSAENLLTIKMNAQNYIEIIRDSYYVETFICSVALGGVSTALCLIFGFAMSYAIYSASDKVKSALLLLISFSFWLSFLIRVYAWISISSANGLINSILLKLGIIDAPLRFIGNYCAAAFGMIFCYLPLMIFPLYAALQKLDKVYIEAAYDLGAGPVTTFWRVTIPITRNGIISGCLMVFATSIGEYAIPELLGGADMNVFGRVLWNEFFVNLNWPMACALSIVMMIFIIVPILIFQNRSGGRWE